MLSALTSTGVVSAGQLRQMAATCSSMQYCTPSTTCRIANTATQDLQLSTLSMWGHCCSWLCRENGFRKRRSRMARQRHQRSTCHKVVLYWRQHARDSIAFRQVLHNIGIQMHHGLMVESFQAWRDRCRVKTWKEGAMLKYVLEAK